MARWETIVEFWFGGDDREARSARWFRSTPADDEALARRFGEDHAAVVAGDREDWLDSPRACLAYVITLDQFSRSFGRGTAEAFAHEAAPGDAVDAGVGAGVGAHVRRAGAAWRRGLLCAAVLAGAVAACGGESRRSGADATADKPDGPGPAEPVGEGEGEPPPVGGGEGEGEPPVAGGEGEGEPPVVGGEGEGEGEAPPPDVSERGCERLEERPGRRVEIAAGDVAGLVQAVNTAAPGDRIFLADGTYELVGQYIWIDVDDVSLRGASGDRDAVVLDGGYTTTEVVTVAASDVWVADLTIRRAFTHPIHVTGAQGGNADRTVIHNVRLTDPGQQAIKINQRGGGDGGGGQTYADDGVIACSWIELTDAGRPEIRDNCYTGGVDAHQAWGWRIHDNHIEGFWCEGGLSEHGVHMWRGCRDTVVERNTIVNCARGVGFGLVNSPADNQRMPDIAGGDDPCPELREGAYVDHWGGTVRNNMIFADDPGLFASQSGFDGGVSMWNACAVTVAHNTVWSTQAPFLSIETRFDGTYALVANNLVSHRIQARTEGTAELLGNVQDAGAAWFVDAVGGDLHLAPGGGSPAHGGGADLPEGVCDEDFDGDPRTPPRDVGADELP